MKPTTTRVVLITILALPLLLVFADEYPALRFRGDGQFSGGPVFGYWIRLKAIPFGQAGQYTFHLRGIPNEQMSLQLYTDGESDRSALTNLSTQLEAVLTDQKGRVVCEGAGVVPKEGGALRRPQSSNRQRDRGQATKRVDPHVRTERSCLLSRELFEHAA